MTAVNPITVSEEEPFVIGKSDLAYFFNNPCRCDCALVLLCTSGHAQVTVDLRRGPLQLNTIVLLLPGSVLMLDDASDDFSVRFGAFSPDLFGGGRISAGALVFQLFEGKSHFSSKRKNGCRIVYLVRNNGLHLSGSG